MRRALELEPDLIVAVKEENTRENIEALEEAGVPVFVGAPESVEGAIELLQELADRVEAPRAGPSYHVGGSDEVNDITLTLDDEAANDLPDDAPLEGGVFKPTNDFNTSESLSAFDGTNPNDTWNLRVVDHVSGDCGENWEWMEPQNQGECPLG